MVVRKAMDQEKTNGVVICISVETANKQCMDIKVILFLLICQAAGRPYSRKPLFAPICCSYTSPSSNSLASTWHLYMAIFTVCTLNLLNLDVVLYIPVFITTIHAIFQDVYHQQVGIAGLHYLALGIGLTVGSQLSTIFMDQSDISNPAMGVLESLNLDCVSISIQSFVPSPKQLMLLCYSHHRSWDNPNTYWLADYWLVHTESCFLAHA